jgi:hypothetical protein
MAKSILQQVTQLINTGSSLEQAIAAIIPGADLTIWQRRVAQAANPPKKAKKNSRRRSSGSGQPSKRTNYASQVLSRGYAMAELTTRANTRSILVTANGQTSVLEVLNG